MRNMDVTEATGVASDLRLPKDVCEDFFAGYCPNENCPLRHIDEESILERNSPPQQPSSDPAVPPQPPQPQPAIDESTISVVNAKPSSLGSDSNDTSNDVEESVTATKEGSPQLSSKVCADFVTLGFCPAGEECVFRHPNPDEDVDMKDVGVDSVFVQNDDLVDDNRVHNDFVAKDLPEAETMPVSDLDTDPKGPKSVSNGPLYCDDVDELPSEPDEPPAPTAAAHSPPNGSSPGLGKRTSDIVVPSTTNIESKRVKIDARNNNTSDVITDSRTDDPTTAITSKDNERAGMASTNSDRAIASGIKSSDGDIGSKSRNDRGSTGANEDDVRNGRGGGSPSRGDWNWRGSRRSGGRRKRTSNVGRGQGLIIPKAQHEAHVRNEYYCAICEQDCNSAENFKSHRAGKKHKRQVRIRGYDIQNQEINQQNLNTAKPLTTPPPVDIDAIQQQLPNVQVPSIEIDAVTPPPEDAQTDGSPVPINDNPPPPPPLPSVSPPPPSVTPPLEIQSTAPSTDRKNLSIDPFIDDDDDDDLPQLISEPAHDIMDEPGTADLPDVDGSDGVDASTDTIVTIGMSGVDHGPNGTDAKKSDVSFESVGNDNVEKVPMNADEKEGQTNDDDEETQVDGVQNKTIQVAVESKEIQGDLEDNEAQPNVEDKKAKVDVKEKETQVDVGDKKAKAARAGNEALKLVEEKEVQMEARGAKAGSGDKEAERNGEDKETQPDDVDRVEPMSVIDKDKPVNGDDQDMRIAMDVSDKEKSKLGQPQSQKRTETTLRTSSRGPVSHSTRVGSRPPGATVHKDTETHARDHAQPEPMDTSELEQGEIMVVDPRLSSDFQNMVTISPRRQIGAQEQEAARQLEEGEMRDGSSSLSAIPPRRQGPPLFETHLANAKPTLALMRALWDEARRSGPVPTLAFKIMMELLVSPNIGVGLDRLAPLMKALNQVNMYVDDTRQGPDIIFTYWSQYHPLLVGVGLDEETERTYDGVLDEESRKSVELIGDNLTYLMYSEHADEHDNFTKRPTQPIPMRGRFPLQQDSAGRQEVQLHGEFDVSRDEYWRQIQSWMRHAHSR